jgi:ketosteroid isomerase-like protein
VHKDVSTWLDAFQNAVRERNFDRGLELYAETPVLFGTRVRVSDNTREYLEAQWKPIWNSSDGFEFTEVLQVEQSENLVTCATIWANVTEIDGQKVSRRGRATFVFRKTDQGLIAVQSHFSEDPRHT